MQKQVKKLIIPAGGWGTRFLPMTKIIHKELVPILNKPMISYLVEEAFEAGIEEVIIVISSRKFELIKYFEVNHDLELELFKKRKFDLLKRVKKTNITSKIRIVIQPKQKGLADAIKIGCQWIYNEPFAIILGDDLIKSKMPPIKQLINLYQKTNSSILGVQNVALDQVNKYGIVKPKNENEKRNTSFEIKGAIEKPHPKNAPSTKAIIGRYIFTYNIVKYLDKIKANKNDEFDIVDTFKFLLKEENMYALEIVGKRYDLGSMDGFVKANIDFALENKEIGSSIKEFIKDKNL